MGTLGLLAENQLNIIAKQQSILFSVFPDPTAGSGCSRSNFADRNSLSFQALAI